MPEGHSSHSATVARAVERVAARAAVAMAAAKAAVIEGIGQRRRGRRGEGASCEGSFEGCGDEGRER